MFALAVFLQPAFPCEPVEHFGLLMPEFCERVDWSLWLRSALSLVTSECSNSTLRDVRDGSIRQSAEILADLARVDFVDLEFEPSVFTWLSEQAVKQGAGVMSHWESLLSPLYKNASEAIHRRALPTMRYHDNSEH